MKGQYTVLLILLTYVLGWGQPPDTTSVQDTVTPTTYSDSVSVSMSPEGPEATVYYKAQDSMDFDLLNKRLYLYGDAQVLYEDIQLNAHYIEVDFEKSVVTAKSYADSSGAAAGYPVFQEGAQSYAAEEMRYNYRTKKGLAIQGRTQQSDLYVLGNRVKFVSDTENDRNYVYNKDVIITTCDRPVPHFGIRTSKLKVITEEIAVAGPSNLQIAGIPTPLLLPFGFFPITDQRSAGLIFPSGYEYSPRLGYGISQLGYFRPINEYMNMTVYAQAYTRGTWGLNALLDYKKRYKMSGNLSLSYVKLREENPANGALSTKNTWDFRWSHRQDPKAHPYNSFGGNVQFVVNNQQQEINASYEAQAQNIINSSMTFRRRFPNGLWNLTAGLTHSQNTQNRQVTVRFPTFDANLSSHNPFDDHIGEEKWYEKLVLAYSSKGLVEFNGVDSTFFSKQTLQEAEYGIRHDVNLDLPFNVLRYFKFTPSARYSEDWYFYTFRKQQRFTIDTISVYDADSTLVQLYDTMYAIDNERVNGFKPLRRYSFSMNMNVNVYGNARFKKFWLRALRHSMRVGLNLSYSPDYTRDQFGYFESYANSAGEEVQYAIFEPVGNLRGVNASETQRLSLGINLNNSFQAKIWSKRDSALRKITLMDNLSVSSNYNFAADSFQLSDIRASGAIRFLNRMTTIGLGFQLDPYQVVAGRRIDRFTWQDGGFALPRLKEFRVNMNTNLSVDQVERLFKQKRFNKENKGAKEEQVRSTGIADLQNIIRGLRVSHRLNFVSTNQPERGIDTSLVSGHNISMSFNALQITPNWNVRVNNVGYDFLNKRITYPDFTFNRDLHCWTMSLSVQPTLGTYNFRIAVKPGSLGFIDVPYRRNVQDAQQSLF